MKLTEEQKRQAAVQAVLRRIGEGKGNGKPLSQQIAAELRRREKTAKLQKESRDANGITA
jgi:hypothetical protein